MEITLSRLFNVLDLEEAATAIIVHLADFDEEWVLNTAGKLNEGFTDEVLEGDLHVIHAPRDIYPLKQANVEAFRLSGFKQTELNDRYTRHADAATDRVSYRSATGMHLVSIDLRCFAWWRSLGRRRGGAFRYVLVWCVQRTRAWAVDWPLVFSFSLGCHQQKSTIYCILLATKQTKTWFIGAGCCSRRRMWRPLSQQARMHSYKTTAGTKSRFFEPLSLESRRHLALLPSPWSDGRKLTHHARIALQAGEDKDSSIDVYVCMYVYVHTFTYAYIYIYICICVCTQYYS